MGEYQRLRDTRLFFQYATERALRDVIERLTGREVRGFVSGLDAQRDISAEVFYSASTDESRAANAAWEGRRVPGLRERPGATTIGHAGDAHLAG